MISKILFKYTSRSRPQRFFEGLDSIVKNISNKDDYHILCSFDEDDSTMNTSNIVDRLRLYENLSFVYGTSKNKVDAINRDMDTAPAFDILVNFSDDQVITAFGFDNLIRVKMGDDTDKVLHFPDTITKDKLITMSVMGKKYYDRFGFIYNPAYISLYCDNEFGDIANMLGKYTFVPEYIYLHNHPAYGMAQTDAQYAHTESFYHIDGKTYYSRKARNFLMTVPLLSILIPSLTSRDHLLKHMVQELMRQKESCDLKYQVEIVLLIDDGENSTGHKRNVLIDMAKGVYVVFIDDDDYVYPYYVEEILKAADLECDAMAINGIITTNGTDLKKWFISKDNGYCASYDGEGKEVYLRYQNHISPIKKSIAELFKFPEVYKGEDYAWATEIHNSGLIKTEVTIDKPLYHYKFITHK